MDVGFFFEKLVAACGAPTGQARGPGEFATRWRFQRLPPRRHRLWFRTFSDFLFRLPPFGKQKKLKNGGGALQRQSIFASTICRFFVLKKKIYKNKSPPQAGRIFFACFPEVAWHMFPVEGCHVPGVGAG